jgi:Peptidase M15
MPMRQAIKPLLTGTLVILFLGTNASIGLAQEEAWVEEVTVNGEPPPGGEELAFANVPRPPGLLGSRGWWASLTGFFRGVRLSPSAARSNQTNVLPSGAIQAAALSRNRRLFSVGKSVLRGSKTRENIELYCRGGARTWNIDQDVYLTVKLWVDGNVVFAGYGVGPAPTAVAHGPIATADHDRDLLCTVDAQSAFAQVQAIILADCGDGRTWERAEYFTSSEITPKPACNDFINYVPSLSQYGFDGQWNSSPSYPWAILKDYAVGNLYCVVANYGSTPTFNSGYRNPAHNSSVSPAVNSQHIHGTAADLDTPAAPNDSMYNDLRSLAKVAHAVTHVSSHEIFRLLIFMLTIEARARRIGSGLAEGGMTMIALLLLFGLVQAQSATQKSPLASRLVDLDLGVRVNAAVELERAASETPSVLADKATQDSLVTLLERENDRIAENWTKVVNGGKSTIDESYGEYYSVVFGLANKARSLDVVAPAVAARLRRALVFGSYNPDSQFVQDVAREGDSLVPLVIELSKQQSGPKKWNAYGLAAEMFAQAEKNSLSIPLTAPSAAILRSIARDGLLDPAPDVRKWAIVAVSKARDKEAIPLLEKLAASDPDAKPVKYSVRSIAAEALKQIR